MQTVSLVEARLLTRARSGEAPALAAIWTRWRNPLWSMCMAMAGDKPQAIALLKDLYADLPSAARSWACDEPLCCLVASWAFGRLRTNLKLPGIEGIEVRVPEVVEAPSPKSISASVRRLSPQVRLVYLIDLFFRCPASTTAALAGVSERDLRYARATAAWSMVAGSAP